MAIFVSEKLKFFSLYTAMNEQFHFQRIFAGDGGNCLYCGPADSMDRSGPLVGVDLINKGSLHSNNTQIQISFLSPFLRGAALLVNGLSKEEQEARIDLVLALPERIQAIPDGSTIATKQTGGWAASSSDKNTKFNSDGNFDNEFFQQSEEGNQFRQEYEMRKLKHA